MWLVAHTMWIVHPKLTKTSSETQHLKPSLSIYIVATLSVCSTQWHLPCLSNINRLQDGAALATKRTPASHQTAGIGKDPSTQTGFLPDKARELQEEQMREQLKQEYSLRQQV